MGGRARGSTVRHLLAHASGLAFAERVVQAPVASKRIYSSAGFEVLAELVSRETEIEFADYLAEAVFAPLGMTSAALVGPAATVRRHRQTTWPSSRPNCSRRR
ncbi:hypothetical protein GCM10020255_089970 [Rhodococcus baikonurensis]